MLFQYDKSAIRHAAIRLDKGFVARLHKLSLPAGPNRQERWNAT